MMPPCPAESPNLLRRLLVTAGCFAAVSGVITEAATLRFDTRVGKTYSLETSTDLQHWTALDKPFVGDGNQASLPIPMASTSGFFRLVLPSPYDFDQISIHTAAELGDLRATFGVDNWRTTTKEVLKRTCADAAWLVENDTDPNFFYFWFGGEMSDFTQMLFRLSSAVHETVHHMGFNRITFQNGQFVYSLALGADRFYSVPAMGLFPRSEILPSLPQELQTSGYASTYLTGQSGSQDIVNLLDELNAYTFSAIVDRTVVNQMTGLASVSSRDGVLTFMLYTEAYLQVCRENHPGDYAKLLDSTIPDLIITLWDRAERALKLSQGDPRLGQQDTIIRPHVYAPERMQEIERLRIRVLPRILLGSGS